MPQEETTDKAAVNRLLAAVDNLNACFDEVHRMGLVASVQTPVVELNDGRNKVKTLRMQVQVLRPLN